MKIEDLSLFLTKVSLFKGLNPDKISKCLTEADFKENYYYCKRHSTWGNAEI